MFKRVRNLLVSASTFIRGRRKNKCPTGANAKPSDRKPTGPFDNRELPDCHTGTFDAVLLRLSDWAKNDPAPVLWLRGPTSTAQSAIAHSFITCWKSEDHLAACFFFSKPNGKRKRIKSLLPSLAHQIGRAIPELQSQISKVSADRPRRFKHSFKSQFDELISIPISQLKLSPARRRSAFPILIVVDGLDECHDQRERGLFLKTVFEAAPRLRRYLKFLVVSRPESDIMNFFESTSIQDDVNIVDLSAYLITTAATTERVVVLPKTDCGLARPLHNSDNDIHSLFRNILSSSRTSQTTIVRLLSVVLVCLQADTSPLTPSNDILASLTQSDRFMESIMDLEPRSLRDVLSDLKSLISFRRQMTLDDVRIVEFCHKPLKDFLVDQSRSREFHIDLGTTCLTVAKGILSVLADKGRMEQRYWTSGVSDLECDPRPAYHNCLVWCYERLTPDVDLQRAMMEYDPIDYLSLRASITFPTAVTFFTFACKYSRRFEDLLESFDNATNISDHLRSHLDCYFKSELDYWVPQSSDLMSVLRSSIFPDHIDWVSISDHSEAISRTLDDARLVEQHLPYFLAWMFDKGVGYAGSTVERTVCDFFYSEIRAGKYYLGQAAGVAVLIEI